MLHQVGDNSRAVIQTREKSVAMNYSRTQCRFPGSIPECTPADLGVSFCSCFTLTTVCSTNSTVSQHRRGSLAETTAVKLVSIIFYLGTVEM